MAPFVKAEVCLFAKRRAGLGLAQARRLTEEWVFTLIAVNGFLSAVSLPVNAWWTGTELKQFGHINAFFWWKLQALGLDFFEYEHRTLQPIMNVDGI